MSKLRESQRRAIDKWDAANTKRVYLKFSLNRDRAILDKLDSVENKIGYIRDLINKDLGENDANNS